MQAKYAAGNDGRVRSITGGTGGRSRPQRRVRRQVLRAEAGPRRPGRRTSAGAGGGGGGRGSASRGAAPEAGVPPRAVGTFTAADEERQRGVRRMKTIATGAAAARGDRVRPRQVGAARGRGRLGRLCRGGRRGGHGRRAGRLVRGHRALPPPARPAHPAHRDHPDEEGPARRSAWATSSARTSSPRDVVRARLRAVGIGSRLGAWLARAGPRRPGHRRAGDRAARRARPCCGTPTCRRWSARRSPAAPTRRRSRPASARCWRRSSRTAATGGSSTWCARGPHDWLVLHSDSVMDAVRAARPAGRPRFVDRQVGERVYKELLRFVTEMRDMPDHPARGAVDRFLTDFAADLQSDTGHPGAGGAAQVRGARPRRGAGPDRLRLDRRTLDDRRGGRGRAQRTAAAGAGVAAVAGRADGVGRPAAGQGRRLGRGRGGVRGDDLPGRDHLADHATRSRAGTRSTPRGRSRRTSAATSSSSGSTARWSARWRGW